MKFDIADSIVKIGDLFIKLTAAKILNLVLLGVIYYFYVQVSVKDAKIETQDKAQKEVDKDCATKESQCERRLSMQAESYSRVHNELRDRMENESRERIKTWQARFDSQQAQLESTRMKQDVLDNRLNKISKQ